MDITYLIPMTKPEHANRYLHALSLPHHHLMLMGQELMNQFLCMQQAKKEILLGYGAVEDWQNGP